MQNLNVAQLPKKIKLRLKSKYEKAGAEYA